MTKPLIYITRKIPKKIIKPIEHLFTIRMWEQEYTPVPKEVLLKEIQSASGLLCLVTDKIDQSLLRQAPHLKIIANMAVGYDNIDIDAAKNQNIIVTNTPDVLTETTADLTFALLLGTARRMIEASNYIREDKWENWSPFMLAGSDVHHKTIGIVGMGRIGEAVARRAKGFGMSILYHNRTRNIEAENHLAAQYVSFNEVLTKSDFVISLVPLTNETEEMFNEEAFKRMNETAIFINVSRGKTVDEDALYRALKNKEITAAGLDVFKDEPIRAGHPLLELENVVCIPHIGSASIQTRLKMLELCISNIASVFNGKEPKTPVFKYEKG